MARTWIIVLVIAVLIVVGVYFLAGSSQEKTSPASTGAVIETQNPATATPTQSSQETTSDSEAKTYNIEIENFAFSPATLRIKKGDKVVWTNKDSARHTVTSDSGGELGSELLGKGESYSKTFTETGTYEYHCTPHLYMKAKIIVE